MNEDQLIKLLQYYEKESKVFMPNEIFEDIQKPFKLIAAEKKQEPVNDFLMVETIRGSRKKRGKNKEAVSSHIAFAYSHYYLVSWLYRYAKYGAIKVTVEDIKQILGYSKTNTKIDFIIKKHGVMDQIGYTETTTNYPVLWDFENEEFEYINDITDTYTKKMHLDSKGRNFKIKMPIKHIYRTQESYENGEWDGLFYEPYNFHSIPFEVFLFCMGKKDLGVKGFYLYSYLKRMNEYYGRGYDVPIHKLSDETSIPKSTLEHQLDQLRKYRMIDCIYNQDYFVPGLEDEDRKANTYLTKDYTAFSDTKISIKKMQIMNKNDYLKMKDELENTPTEQEIEEWGLPLQM